MKNEEEEEVTVTSFQNTTEFKEADMEANFRAFFQEQMKSVKELLSKQQQERVAVEEEEEGKNDSSLKGVESICEDSYNLAGNGDEEEEEEGHVRDVMDMNSINELVESIETMFSPEAAKQPEEGGSILQDCQAPSVTNKTNHYCDGSTKEDGGGTNVFFFSPTHSSEKKKATSKFQRNQLWSESCKDGSPYTE